MVTDLFRNERLKTTDTRAKEIRRVAEKIITMAKEGSLHKRRLAGAYVRDKEVLKKLFDELGQKFKDRPGGYTRITKLGFRKGDNTPISVIELVEEEYKPSKKKKTAPKKKTTPKATDAPKAKSSKKESAEELGLIEDEEKKAAKALAEAEPEVAVSEPEAASEEESQVEEKIEAKADEAEEAPEESSETEQDEEAQKKED
jgi:large subunit ribosomal protein L17